MRRASLTSGLPFKSALWACLVFLLVCGVSGLVLVRVVENTLVAELTSQARSEAVLLSEIFDETGQAGLVQALQVTSRTVQGSERFAGFLESDGTSLTGPVSVVPDFVGTRRMSVDQLSVSTMAGSYIVHVRKIDRRTLVVGRSDAPVRMARNRLIVGLLAFAGVISLAMIGLGLWASRMSLGRLEGMDAALRKVGEGEMSARLPVLGQHDQFDQVSTRVNQHLAHLERTVNSTKATASAIAHDLKTPLGHVQIALDAATEAAATQKDPRPHIEDALQEAHALNTIFEAVLRISRIRATDDSSRFAAVSLDALAEKAVEFLSPLAEESGQRLVVDSAHPAPVQGDEGMLQQAVINIVQNAVVHAGPEARITLVVTDHRFEVRDTGAGAPDQDLDRLLEPFVRADATRLSEGSGLGLALVNAVAERHGATVTLRNLDPGFSVTLDFPHDERLG